MRLPALAAIVGVALPALVARAAETVTEIVNEANDPSTPEVTIGRAAAKPAASPASADVRALDDTTARLAARPGAARADPR